MENGYKCLYFCPFEDQFLHKVSIVNEMAQNWHTPADDTEMKVWYDI